MAIVLAYENSTNPYTETTEVSHIKSDLNEIGNHWAQLVLTGIRKGEKPEILIDRSGSMSNPVIKGISRMDVARALMASLARELREIAPGFDLNQIPVKSWGSAVYDKHEAVNLNTLLPVRHLGFESTFGSGIANVPVTEPLESVTILPPAEPPSGVT